uniref:Uncharacterized protein n=1 Tax=Rhizophora mucronata TaxID=61149 RepID=A0A2P2PT36_RHIMU
MKLCSQTHLFRSKPKSLTNILVENTTKEGTRAKVAY